MKKVYVWTTLMTVRFSLLILTMATSLSQASGIEIKVTSIKQSGENVIVQYNLTTQGTLTHDTPVYVFLTYSTDGTNPLIPYNRAQKVSSDVGIVNSTGNKIIIWNWYSEPGVPYNFTFPNARIKLHAIEMVNIPQDGSLIMGNDDNAPDQINGVAQVPPFYLMKYPVTVKQYVDFLNAQANNNDPVADIDHDYWDPKMANNIYGHIKQTGVIGAGASWSVHEGYEDYAMVYVTWYNAYDYAKWAGLNLCIEEEFEKAARGTDSRRYNWGNILPNNTLCNYENNIGCPSDVNIYEYGINKQGGSPYGAYDLAGNVWEWQDTYKYSSGYDSSKSKTDYNSKRDSLRVLRGGSWKDDSKWMQAAVRKFEYIMTRDNSIGFRCVIR